MAQSSALYGVPNPHHIINVVILEIAFAQKKKPAAPFDDVTGFFILLLWSRNHGKSSDNLWSLSAQKYFWLEEPEIIKKIRSI